MKNSSFEFLVIALLELNNMLMNFYPVSLINKSILICNKSISHNFDKNIKTFVIKNIGRRSFWGKYKLKKLLSQINPDIVHTHGSKTTSIISSINKKNYKHVAKDMA